MRLAKWFPLPPLSDAIFNIWLHRFVFWYNLKKFALALLLALFESICRSGKETSYELDEYIDDSRARH